MHRVLAVALVLALPTVLAAEWQPVGEVLDPAREIAIYRGWVQVPVDSIDLVRVVAERSSGGFEGATARVVDLDRRGLEDVLFVHREHTSRVVGFVAVFDVDGKPAVATLAAVRVEPPKDGFSEGYIGVLVEGPQQIRFLNVTGFHDVATNTIGVRLDEPLPGELVFFGALAGLIGCDSMEDCESAGAVMAVDSAPDGGADWIASVIPAKSFADIFPEDDGSVSGPARSVYGALKSVRDALRDGP